MEQHPTISIWGHPERNNTPKDNQFQPKEINNLKKEHYDNYHLIIRSY
ncbi:Putative protein [Zobellia galactanivorans]|uniref:Uncharacterized protein n=1 Tax=Zobellia galactanivorans (strain DSM 12802 / CCUG 47099 / CIP 106680 / NCIMB 13871 / Dsij) TaxID=63186 RepID=G0L2R6_ZOBGA|nr:Putative protein [Zobellia galactanivorans]